MALFGKKTCPNCGQPQEKTWDKCPFCINMGMGGGGGAAMGGGMTGMSGPPAGGMGPPMGAPMGGPPTQFGGGGYGGPPAPGGGGGYGAAPAGAGAAQKTMMFQGGQQNSSMQMLGWLVPLKGPHRGELHTLKNSATIGKDAGCDVVFNDSFMSGRHATIRAQGGTYILEDHSTNGTFVNDKKISRHELVDSDFVKFGQTLVKFKCL